MRSSTLIRRNLAWYWRTNLAVVLGVATAVSVLAGALLVGSSVRASLRDQVRQRLGRADYVISSAGFFREKLAAAFPDACPLISLEGIVMHEATGRRAMGIQVYGIDERFWNFQRWSGEIPQDSGAMLSGALAREFGSRPGDVILLRVESLSAIPLESLHGRKEDTGRTMRLVMRNATDTEFSVRPRQDAVRAIFVPLRRLQRDLARQGRINTILVAGGTPETTLRAHYTLEDLGIRIRSLPEWLSVETESTLLDDALAAIVTDTARRLGLNVFPVLSYLANSMRAGSKEIPYSLVAAIPVDEPVLNQWAARELGAGPGDSLRIEYYVWKDDGRLYTESATLRIGSVAPIQGRFADRDLVPEYPGITETESLRDWDPPFPIDLKRIRPADEDYWKRYRTTPKLFVPLAYGQQLWRSRFGQATSIRVSPSPAFADALRAGLDPLRAGLTVFAAREQGLEAARGAADFGEYFVYFSFFLVASALLLTGLFFKLGVEQRLREIGTLRALGFAMRRLRGIFLLEGVVLSLLGAGIGVAGAGAYAGLIMHGLRTWWIGAVGTTALHLHVSLPGLTLGGAAGIVTGLASIAWTLRRLQPVTPRGLLAGAPPKRSGRVAAPLALVAAAGLLMLLANPVIGFFGAGTLLLAAILLWQKIWLSRPGGSLLRSVAQLGLRNAGDRPGRSTLCIALIACATFLIVSVDAFRRDGQSSTGGYPFMAESVLPLVRENLPPIPGVRFVPFRLKPGDDASCLNLYQPRNPRILAAPPEFLKGDLAPLASPQADGAVPAMADANSLEYSLHLKVGDVLALDGNRFRIVGALRDSIFQGELLVSEKDFLRLFPQQPGYRFFLLDVDPHKAAQISAALEDELADYGFDVMSTAERLAAFHRVENTYLSTFQTLGGFGLVLGTVGLSAILLRNALERRRELALLRAVGYRPRNLAFMALAENTLLLIMGLIAGAVCALLAILPAAAQRGGRPPGISLAILLAAVLLVGLAASVLATMAALRSPLLAALRSE